MKNDPIKRDDIDIEKARRRWPTATDDEILGLLVEWANELDGLEKKDQEKGDKA